MASKSKIHDQAAADKSIKRIRQLMQEEMSYQEMAEILNSENYRTLRGCAWSANNLRVIIHRLREKLNSWYGLSSKRCGFTPEPLAA